MVVSRRDFIVKESAATAGGLALAGPLSAFSQRVAAGVSLEAPGYGPLVDKGELSLPKRFSFKVICCEATPRPTAQHRARSTDGRVQRANGNAILIRNHENRALVFTEIRCCSE